MSRLLISTAAVMMLIVVGCSDSSSQTLPDDASGTGSAIDRNHPVDTTSTTSTWADPLDAAIAYVASTDELMGHSPVGRREIFRKLAVAAAVDEQARSFEEAASKLAATLNIPVERLVWVEAPITATVVASTPVTASVDVWTVSILGAPAAGPPQQVWRTVHVDLELVSDRWLVVSAAADAGPTPAANELAMQAGWRQFEEVASWPAVVEGVGL